MPFVCGARDLGEALRRIAEGAAMIRSKGEAGSGSHIEQRQDGQQKPQLFVGQERVERGEGGGCEHSGAGGRGANCRQGDARGTAEEGAGEG